MLSTPRTKSMIGSPIWRLTRTDVSMHYVHDVALVATVTWLGGGGSIAGGGVGDVARGGFDPLALSTYPRNAAAV